MNTKQVTSALLASVLFCVKPALGQEAPTGAHYGGRASDTGAGGAQFSSAGDFAGGIPLVLPPERSGLPIPLQIVYHSNAFGALGLGWDIPLSYIQGGQTLAHRRPLFTNTGIKPRERLYLSLPGARGELLQDGNVWRLRRGALDISIRKSNGIFKLYDGAGRIYTFSQPAAIKDADLWLLDSIGGSGGSVVHLEYDLRTMDVPGSQALEIDLARLTYNSSTRAACPKTQIVLSYGGDAATPLSLSSVGNMVTTRFRVLAQIDVQGVATCGHAESLRRTLFTYTPDADTQQLRLAHVKIGGRQDTPEHDPVLPVADFSYGSVSTAMVGASDGNRVLQYAITQTIPLPVSISDDLVRNLAGTETDGSISTPGNGERSALWHDLIDLDGDGRIDYLFKTNGALSFEHNSAGDGGISVLGAEFPLQTGDFPGGPLSKQSSTTRRFWYGTANRNTVDQWRQLIDVNGDGRIDIIDAGEQPGQWTIYLNMPGGPGGVTWVRRSVSVAYLAAELKTRGHVLDGGYVPLSRRSTGVSASGTFCLKRNAADAATPWSPYTGTLVDQAHHPVITCDAGLPSTAPPRICMADNSCAPDAGVESTFVEWELQDLNGDGYPDVVFNTKPVELSVVPGSGIDGQFYGANNDIWVGRTQELFGLPESSRLHVAYNMIGNRLDTVGQYPFARSIELPVPKPEWGVALWQSAQPWIPGSNRQVELAALADVNGDGLVDRVEAQDVYLGVFGYAVHPFSAVKMQLPPSTFLAEQISNQQQRCLTSHDVFFNSELTQGLRDINGDGIPDFFYKDRNGSIKVFVGTGAGFAALPLAVISTVQLSHQREACDGSWSETDGGLFDVDGDGKPDMVTLVNGEHDLLVAQLSNGLSPRAAEAGRITVIDNGYGAKTTIGYQSAKEDQYSEHAVPFPEIVATAVSTVGTQQQGGSLAGSRFAYGNAKMIFDSASDRFSFAGYQRHVKIALFTGKGEQPMGMATVADAWPLTDFHQGLTKKDVWLSELRLGLPRDLYVLSGTPEIDPWALLHIDNNDSRIIAGQHTEWASRLFELSPQNVPDSGNLHECVDMVLPYDWAQSTSYALGPDNWNPCLAHGFVRSDTVTAWEGPTKNIQTRSQVLSVDDYGRVTSSRNDNDVFRGDDDVCIETVFATPLAADRHVLSAPSSQKILDCDKRTILASESYGYDGLAPGRVSLGHLTFHTVDRRVASGASLGAVRRFDARYDTDGNVSQVRSRRGNDTRTVSFEYDAFGLFPIRATVAASNIQPSTTWVRRDPVSLQVIGETDSHGVRTGVRYDVFGRPVLHTLTLPGSAAGVVSTIAYAGFEDLSTEGREVTMTRYLDPVPEAALSTAVGQSTTTYLDELGRTRRAELLLGADYNNETVIIGDRSYDDVGRVFFSAEPYLKSQAAAPHFGSTYYFNNNGEPNCAIRGQGVQPFTRITDLSQNRYVMCFEREFDNHVVNNDVIDPTSLQWNTPEDWVRHRSVTSATGVELERSTIKSNMRLDYATFEHDRLAQRTSMTRFQRPDVASNPVKWSWQLDSLGQMLELSEPGLADRFFDYDDWGALTDMHWTDGAAEKMVTRSYDALGRLLRSEERLNSATDPATVATFSYDVAANLSPLVVPENVRGRLSQAKWAGGAVALGYDALGRVNAEVFADDAAGIYIDRYEYYAAGPLASLTFQLPDDSFIAENIQYKYDSAQRLRSIAAVDANGAATLYQAQDVDSYGRVRKAQYGDGTVLTADYADTARRLIREFEVSSPGGSRRIVFGDFDATGRERFRQEFKNDVASPQTTYWYNDLGQLASVSLQGSTLGAWKFDYDGLGNFEQIRESTGTEDVSFSYRTDDPDRICRVEYSSNLTDSACNVGYNALGAVTDEPTRAGSRHFTYFSSGAVRSIAQGGATAQMAYDAFGRTQKLNIDGGPSGDQHRDREFGWLIERRDIIANNAHPAATQILRRVPGPSGIVATRRGPGNDWIFALGESRGTRFATDETGKFQQDIGYQPYGEATSTGVQPGSADYTVSQWNNRPSLEAFGLSGLGARMYDPVIGRFLSRDPLLAARGSASSNPYAFALNDPVNSSDPTGLSSCASNDPFCITNTYDPGSDGSLASAAANIAWGVWSVLNSGNGSSGTSLRAVTQPVAEGAGPSTPQGVMLQYLSQSQLGYVVAGFNYDSAAATGESSSSILDRLAELPSPERDTQIDAYNAKLDRYAHYARVGGLMVAGGALGIGAAAAAVGLTTGGAIISAEAVGVGVTGAELAPAVPGAVMAADEYGPELSEAAECGLAGCGGPGVCFVGDTLVATSTGALPIKNIHVGDRVSAENSDCSQEHLPPGAVTINLEMPNPNQASDMIHLTLVRARSWLSEHDMRDDKVLIEMPEQGLSGWATVLSVGAPPSEENGAGCLVLSSITHIADQVMALQVEGGAALKVTPEHRLYVEGQGWTAAREVRMGQSLRSIRGPQRLLGVTASTPNQRVFNIEVGTEHSYRVGEQGIWAHNVCEDPLKYLRLVSEEFNAAYERLGVKVLELERSAYANEGLRTLFFTAANGDEKTYGSALLEVLIDQADRFLGKGQLSPADIEDLGMLVKHAY